MPRAEHRMRFQITSHKNHPRMVCHNYKREPERLGVCWGYAKEERGGESP